jgi:hypothetical protein
MSENDTTYDHFEENFSIDASIDIEIGKSFFTTKVTLSGKEAVSFVRKYYPEVSNLVFQHSLVNTEKDQ